MRISDWSSDVCSSELRLRRDLQLAVAHLAQHILAGVRHTLETGQAEKSAGSLDRVHQAEDVAKQLLVVGILLELHQLDVQLRKAFVGLGQKFTQQIIHRLSPTFAWQPGFKSGAIAAVDPSPKKSQNTRKERLRTPRSEEHTSELQSLMRISYAVFCLKKKTN